jgi:hypothetical protein
MAASSVSNTSPTTNVYDLKMPKQFILILLLLYGFVPVQGRENILRLEQKTILTGDFGRTSSVALSLAEKLHLLSCAC